MKIMITGGNGQVGYELQRSMAMLGEVIALSRQQVDLSKPETLNVVVKAIKPDVIINAAAYTNVDKAEEEEKLATLINGDAVGELAIAAREINALFVQYSTDYVFDGNKKDPYTESDAVNPLNAYGRSKLVGEKALQSINGDYLIFRISWIYSLRSQNFLRTMLRLGLERQTIKVVNDQFGSPTPASFVADATAHAVRQAMLQKTGKLFVKENFQKESIKNNNFQSKDFGNESFQRDLFHLSTNGSTSWHGFAKDIFECARDVLPANVLKVKNIEAIFSTEYKTIAKRPKNSILNNTKFDQCFDCNRLNWQTALKETLAKSNKF